MLDRLIRQQKQPRQDAQRRRSRSRDRRSHRERRRRAQTRNERNTATGNATGASSTSRPAYAGAHSKAACAKPPMPRGSVATPMGQIAPFNGSERPRTPPMRRGDDRFEAAADVLIDFLEDAGDRFRAYRWRLAGQM